MRRIISNSGSLNSGFFLPIAACFIALILLSVLILSAFGSGTRNIMKHADVSMKCRLAASSAILEARRKLEAETQRPVEGWEPWLRELLPPLALSKEMDSQYELEISATPDLMNKYNIDCANEVIVTCLDKGAYNGRFQGLLSFRVVVSANSSRRNRVEVMREERVRFIIQRSLNGQLRVKLLPGYEALTVRG